MGTFKALNLVKNELEMRERDHLSYVLQNRYSERFRKFHKKTSVLEFVFDKADRKTFILLKRDSVAGVFL